MQFSYKQIWIITYPVLISLLMEQLIGMTDTAFLGRVGEIELGASALAGVYYLAIFMIGFGFRIGAQILMARRNGEQEYKQIGSIFTQGILFLLVLAAVMFTLSRIYSPVILHKLIGSEQVYAATLSYIDWRVYGFFFSFVAEMFRAFYVATTRTKILTLNSIVMVLSNVVFNYILIFGKFGCPALGIAGAAIGSSLAELVSVLFFVFYTRKKIDYRMYNLFRFTGIKLDLLKRILSVSIWTMLQSFLSLSTWFIFFVAVEHLGERPLAITNIVRNVSAVPFMLMNAFASTNSSLVSNLMGAGQARQVPALCWRVIKMCSLFELPLLLLIAFFPTLILRIYTDNMELVHSAVNALWVMDSSYLVSVPGFIMFFAVSGTGNTRSALVMELIALSIYITYVFVVVFHFRADVALCWTTEHVYAVCILILSVLYMRFGNWQNKKI
ncbi:MATE family efflux transporter [Parabacteroides pacaensis]|uniref:MATE family efflux transporter n=1 Tax=Parabacteroides pacaensis TaxID=2086575 RepID=UPI000D0FDE26|nr:MATE family efflux transporter [Parabacteroides pacaensis]